MKIAIRLIIAVCALSLPAFADSIIYTADLTGANESPATASPATGFAEVTIDTVAQTMLVDVTFSGLVANDTAAHIHCCVAPGGNAGVATVVPFFTGFPIGVTSGTYDHLFDLTDPGTYNPAFITANGGTVAGAEGTLLAGLASDEAYLNIHSTTYPGGEIRGFLVATPEPGTESLLLLGTIALAMALVRRQLTA